jgi:hypothetical protein
MKNITFSAQDEQVALARELAHARGTTLNEEFRAWLQRYVNSQGQDEKQATLRRLIDNIATPAAGEAGFVPLEQRYAPAGTLMREAFNAREARMLKRLDTDKP